LAFHSGSEADHSPPSSAEVKEWVDLYLHSPHRPLWRGAQGEHRNIISISISISSNEDLLAFHSTPQAVGSPLGGYPRLFNEYVSYCCMFWISGECSPLKSSFIFINFPFPRFDEKLVSIMLGLLPRDESAGALS
jgi:hypothetical protein